MSDYVYPILFGIVCGVISRMLMLRTDYRQYPTYLHGKIIHIALGFIASALGAIAVPALIQEEYTAITFLTVAASQFREVRNMERNTLAQLDQYELVSRGNTYIEGIAIAFESRNYLVIFTSMLTTLAYVLFHIIVGIIVAIGCMFLSKLLMGGGKLKDIVDIEYVEPHFKKEGLYVDNIYIMNIGLPQRQEEVLKYGMGFILKPKNFNSRSTIANLGQRQAILHDIHTALGVYRDSGTPALVPLAKRDLDDGRVGVFVLPQEKNIEKAIDIIGNTPTLENAIRMPTKRKKHEGGNIS
ncbi:YIEGIA family protein [Caldibacillus lycopersici]|uniref:YIEGIA family protein n=1 Tax=Perspicuibacillus lycopersici TaxID=1325689 RepID=A0AAE3LQP0_9BACI|nr:YIEGIA family protein [Perspicuibacillus lycopersici]MCU9613719.1 YIEGIA family protein [Perspicuibacillus lycopersici]